MLTKFSKQTALVWVMLTASCAATYSFAAPAVPRPLPEPAAVIETKSPSEQPAETKQVHGKDRLKIRKDVSAYSMQKKVGLYGKVMVPDGAEQVALRDFRMLKQWHDQYVNKTLADRDAYDGNAQSLLEIYGDVSGWGYQDYVDARYEFAHSSWRTDERVNAMDIHNMIGKPWMLGSGALFSTGTAAVWTMTFKAMMAGSVAAPAAIPAWVPIVSGVGAVGLVVSLAAELRQGYWNHQYGDEYQRIKELKNLSAEALEKLKEHAPRLAQARDKILESLIGFYIDDMSEAHTRKALAMCAGADNRYLKSNVYRENGFDHKDIASLSSVIELAMNKAKSGNFAIELRDDGLSSNQSLSYELMFCENKYQFVREKNRSDGVEQLYRVYSPEHLTEMLERLSEMTNLSQFRFQVNSVPFYTKMFSRTRSFRIDGVIQQPVKEADEETGKQETPARKILPH